MSTVKKSNSVLTVYISKAWIASYIQVPVQYSKFISFYFSSEL